MARVQTSQENFTGGELSPLLDARFTLSLYYNGLYYQKNWLTITQGATKFRNGTRYINHARLNADATLIPFRFSVDDRYMLEFTNQKLRFFRNKAPVLEASKTITGITKANPGVVTSASHGFNNGDEVFINDVVGMTELNGKSFIVANKTANTFELTDVFGNNVNTTSYTTYSSGGTAARVYEITTPYAAADLEDLYYCQVADTVFIAHRGYKPQKLTRTGHTSWTIVDYAPTADPFTSANNYPGVVTIFEQRIFFFSTNTSPDGYWASKSADINNMTTGTADDDAFTGKIFQQELNTVLWAVPTADRLILGTTGGETVGTSENNSGMTPTNRTFKPQTYYGSAKMMPLLIDDLIIFNLRNKETLLSFQFDLLKEGFSADNRVIQSEHLTKGGIDRLAFQRGTPNFVWARHNDGRLIGMTYEPKQQVFGLHQHALAGSYGDDIAQVVGIACMPASSGSDELWLAVKRTINGHTVCYIEVIEEDPDFKRPIDFFTGNREDDDEAWRENSWENQKYAWYVDSGAIYDGKVNQTLTVSASSGTGITATAGGATFKSSDVGREIHLFNSRKATITGYTSSTVVTVSIDTDYPWTSTSVASGDWFLAASTVTGLDHLEGETVRIITDGGTNADAVVTNGAITLEVPSSVIIVGLGYDGIGSTMILEGGVQNGASRGQSKHVNSINFVLNNTLGLEYGTDPYKMQDIKFRETKDLPDRPPVLFTGTKSNQSVPDDWDPSKRIYFMQRKALPATVLAISPNLQGVDR